LFEQLSFSFVTYWQACFLSSSSHQNIASVHKQQSGKSEKAKQLEPQMAEQNKVDFLALRKMLNNSDSNR